jgi:hypothetical protein
MACLLIKSQSSVTFKELTYATQCFPLKGEKNKKIMGSNENELPK